MRKKRNKFVGVITAAAGLMALTGVALADYTPDLPVFPLPNVPKATGEYQKANYTGVSTGNPKFSPSCPRPNGDPCTTPQQQALADFVSGFTVPSGKKFSKKAYKPVAMSFRTATGNGTYKNTDPTSVPNPAVRTQVVFDKDLKLNFGGITRCTADLGGGSTATAIAACPDSIVGGGTARIRVTGVGESRVKVTAFVGPLNADNQPTILLFSDPGFTSGQVLVGTIETAKPPWLTGKSAYGVTLDVKIPLLAGGTTSLTEFEVTVGNGYRKGFITGKCPDGVFKSSSRFWFSDKNGAGGAANESADHFLNAGNQAAEKVVKCSA